MMALTATGERAQNFAVVKGEVIVLKPVPPDYGSGGRGINLPTIQDLLRQQKIVKMVYQLVPDGQEYVLCGSELAQVRAVIKPGDPILLMAPDQGLGAGPNSTVYSTCASVKFFNANGEQVKLS